MSTGVVIDPLAAHSFRVTIVDSCLTASLIENAQITTVRKQDSEEVNLLQSYAAYTDSVSDDFGEAGLCGPISHTISEPAPAFVSLVYEDGDEEFTLIFDWTAVSPDDGTVEVTVLA